MEAEEDTIRSHKVILIGDSGVGKTAIIRRFSDNEFRESHITTIGVDFRSKDVDIDGTPIRLQIWDTAGQERFRSIASSYYRGAHAIIIVYAIDDKASFQNVRMWLADIDYNTKPKDSAKAAPTIVKYLVGNKADLSDRRVVEESLGRKEAESYGIKFSETSAKDSTNIEELFEQVARDIKSVASSLENPEGNAVPGSGKPDKSGCC